MQIDRISKVARAIDAHKSAGALLDHIAWPRKVEEKFFERGARQLPEVEYAISRDALRAEERALREVLATIDGEGPVETWLRSVVSSHIDRARMLAAVGTKEFGRISLEVYGGTRTPFSGGSLTNADLARHLTTRLATHGWDEARATDDPPMDATELAQYLTNRIEKRKLPIRVEIDPECTSKAIASARRVRVRPDATFSAPEAEGLYRHEVETHALTALNGAAQSHVPLLRSGGPRTTKTQEGLAVFAELYHRALSVPRLQRLALRVKLVGMAEDNASFLDVYRSLIDAGFEPRDAYLDSARIFRGGSPEGGAAFTKDASYLAGLVEVYTFLAMFVREGFRDECEMLVAGRFSLEDFPAMLELRRLGILERPKYRPRWLRDWTTLLPYFAFTSFLDGIDLAPIAERHAESIRIAYAAHPK